MVSSLTSSAKLRSERANWHAFALAKMTTPQEVARVKSWIRENLAGETYVVAVKETVGNRRFTIATFVRVKEDDDALIFKLAWAGAE
jgi:hypothetical protein